MATEDIRIRIIGEDRTKQAMKSAEGRITKLKKAVFSLKGGMVGLATVMAGRSAKGVIAFNDKIGKLSQRLGASTEALSEYAHVAELAGISFEQLAMSWQRQTRRISEAANGMGEAKGALKELGLSAESLATLAPEEQFEILADAIGNIPDQADRVRLAMKLWDSEGVANLQIVNQGTQAMREQRAEAKRLGLSLSKDATEGAAELNDKMTRISGALRGLANEMIGTFGPTVSSVIESLKWLLQNIISPVMKMIGTAINQVIILVKTLGTALKHLAQFEAKEAWEALKSGFNDMSEVGTAAIDDVLEAWTAVDGGMVKLGNVTIPAFTDKSRDSAKTVSEDWKEAADSMKGSMADAITDMAMGLNSFKDTLESIGDLIARTIIKQKIAEPIAAGISGIVGSFPTSHTGGIVGADTPRFHNGGVVGGLAGNEVPAILQKGEMVLTKEQQKAVGNQVVNVTYAPQVNALDPRTAATVIAQNAPTIIGVIRQAFNRQGTAVAI